MQFKKTNGMIQTSQFENCHDLKLLQNMMYRSLSRKMLAFFHARGGRVWRRYHVIVSNVTMTHQGVQQILAVGQACYPCSR